MSEIGTVAITMAGMGSRFRKAGYNCPKYQIEVLGRPLFDWSMAALSKFREAGWTFTFATRAEDEATPFLERRCDVLGIRIGAVVELEALTDGQATTALALAERSAADRPFAIFNIDTYVAPGAMDPADLASDVAGWIPCFPGPGDGWSFVRTDHGDDAVEVREKTRIAPHATVGLYWFRSVALYRDLYTSYFRGDAGSEHGERYVAPMYNRLIEHGERVVISRLALEDVGMLGTPEQVAAFRATPPPSAAAL